MARRKTTPELVREKYSLAERLRAIRAELFGERGGPEMARRLGIPVRTWYNYEAGVTVPAEVVLRIIQMTSLEPSWLLNGKGPKFRCRLPKAPPAHPGSTCRSGHCFGPRCNDWRKMRRPCRRADASPASPVAETATGEDQHRGNTVLDRGRWRDTPAALVAAGSRMMASRVGNGSRPGASPDASRWSATPCLPSSRTAPTSRSPGPRSLPPSSMASWSSPWEKPPPSSAGSRTAAGTPCSAPRTSAVAPVLVDLEDRPESQRFRRVLWINTPH